MRTKVEHLRTRVANSSKVSRRAASAAVMELPSLRKRIEELRQERDLVEKAIVALTKLAKRRFFRQDPMAG